MALVKLEWRRGGVVKNGQKLKKGSLLLIKTLTLEMSPIGMIQETRKKTETSGVVGSIIKIEHFFFLKIMQIPKQKSRLVKKKTQK